MSERAERIVMDFIDCWHRLALEDALSRIADDMTFKPDIKSAEVVGRANVGELWATYITSIKSYEMTLHTITSNAGTVVLERTERLTLAGNRTATLPIVGIFEIRDDGLISAWRDYWDTSMMMPAG